MSTAALLAGLRLLNPEDAHHLTIWALKQGLVPKQPRTPAPVLAQKLFGLDFPHPIGLAAGFDKDAEVPIPLLKLGFGFVEVGTITPQPQPGNPRPRVFRLPADGAVINRYGFNNQGMLAARARLSDRDRSHGIVGINIGANKTSAIPQEDYVAATECLAPLADYITINVSSPNTPGLRDLQGRDHLAALISAVMSARHRSAPNLPPILLKIAPDINHVQLEDIADVALQFGVNGMIISNTTVMRPASLTSRYRREAGGLSGAPLFLPSTAVLAAMFRLVGHHIPLIGVGGIASGADAYTKIRAGASLVQLYTALVYNGPGLVGKIVTELDGLLARDGFGTLSQAIGIDTQCYGDDGGRQS
jgi:dihydroorotate dehydrogenase